MILKVLLILVLGLAGLVGAHVFVWHTSVAALRVADPRWKAGLLAAFLVLSLSFPATLLLARASGSGVAASAAHLCAAFWLGLCIHLVMTLALAWALIGVLRIAGRAPDASVILGCAAAFALGLSAAGLWNALHVKTKRIEVEIAGLPPQWDGKTIVHLSDLHLGMFQGRRFLSRVNAAIAEIDPEIVLITGDLYDGSCPDPEAFGDLLDSIPSRKGVFFAFGNHEGYLGLDRAREALAKTRIRLLDDEVAVADGLQIIGASFPEHGSERSGNPAEFKGSYDPGMPSILMYHTPTSLEPSFRGLGSQQMSTYFSPDTDFAFAREIGIDLQLSGHAHAGQIFPFNLATRIIYRGFDRGLHRLGGFSIHVSPGTGIWGPLVRTAGDSEITAITLRAAR